MRALVQLSNMRRAGWASLLTCLVCWPRLYLWLDRPEQMGILLAVLAWSAFLLWGFVLAWVQADGDRPVWEVDRRPAAWGWAVGGALVGGVVLARWFDPAFRQLTPMDYPVDLPHWIAITGFGLAFEMLFLVFSPAAVFYRLGGRRWVAGWMAVLFGLYVLSLKLEASSESLPVSLGAGLVVIRLLGSLLAVTLFLRCGLWPPLVWYFLIQCRHLPFLQW